jgi:signal transduction histidine kinase
VPKLNLRLRIAGVLATVCLTIVGALGFALYMASEDMEQALVGQLVSEELESLVERSHVSGVNLPQAGPNLQYYVLSAPEDHVKLPPEIRALGPGHHEVGVGANEKRIAIRDAGGKRYMVVYDEGPHELREARFRQLLLLSLMTAAIVATGLGYALAGVLTRQLDDLASRVAVLAPDEPHPPLERADHDPEVAALARALDQYHTRLIAMMHREQEFTANASHELRTPITAIRTSCELLMGGDELNGKARTRVERIDDAARSMTERIESLLLLARGDPDAPETVRLRRCVEDAVAPYRDEIERKGLEFQLRVPEETALELDRKALQLVLTNLIKNAVRYTRSGFIRATYDDDAKRLTIADSGPGIAAEHRQQVFERHYRADDKPQGLGLGLAIVRRICDDRGWKIEVQSEPGEGSAFSVLFS